MNNPQISIIVPVYNVEQYLPRCIDSILSQSFADFELLLVDDGSKDGSGTICDEYASIDNRISVIHTSNGGASSARNIGLNKCRGTWVTFIDADDYLLSDTLYGGMLDATKEKHYDIFEFPYVRGELSKMTYRPGLYCKKKFDWFYTNLFHNELWGRLFLRSKIDKFRFREDIVIGEDVCFLLEVLTKCNSLYCTNRGGYFYNIDTASSIMRNANTSYLDAQRYVLLNVLASLGLLENKFAVAFYFRLNELLHKSNSDFCDYLKKNKIITVGYLLKSSFSLKKKMKYWFLLKNRS